MRQIITIWKKELKDTFRDRRTLAAMLLIPIILMPLVIVGMSKIMEYQFKKTAEQAVKISIVGENYAPILAEIIKKQDKVEIVKSDNNLKESVAKDKIDAGLIIPSDFDDQIRDIKPVQIKMLTKSTSSKSSSALLRINSALSVFNKQLLEKRFADQKINQNILSEVSGAPEDVATEKERGGFGLGFLLPLFIVIWAITGGQYTAIDISAGEKERKTLEPLLLTPVKRLDIVLGKFLAVSTTALISVVAALGSIYFTMLRFGFGPIGQNGEFQAGGAAAGAQQGAIFDFSVEPQAIILLLVISVLLIFLFSAIILSVAIFARSFKEAQNYVGPMYLFVVMPVAILNAMIGLKPALWFFALPAVNAFLLFREILAGAYDWQHILLTAASLIVYSLIAIFVASKIYSKETVLFKS